MKLIKDILDKNKRERAFYKSLFLIEFIDYPQYAYAVFHAAEQALALNIKKISIIEFGVAGGNGMVRLEKHAKKVSQLTGIEFEIYGFDTGSGLPELDGYKDIMHQWNPGDFKMDIDKLKAKLNNSTLVLGDVKKTVTAFYKEYSPAPIGAILFDLDLYSSTRSALEIFNTNPENLLPRVRCYFDDIMGNETSLCNEYMGERLAIKEYNEKYADKKITPVYHLNSKPYRRKWYGRSFVHHSFNHARYCDFIGNSSQVQHGQLKDD